MKRLLFVIACLSLAVSALADPVTASQARQKASQFLNKRVAKRARAKAPAANALKLMAAGKDNSYYIFNAGDDGGYVVVSGEDATEEILGYSDTGSINPDNMPCGMRMLLENYREQIKEIRTKKYKKTQRTSPKKNYIGEFHISENLRSLFGQGSTDNLDRPFNLLCPSYDGNDNHHCVTGCVATAMAITSEIPAYVSETLRLNIPAIAANTAINWSNIKQDYNQNYSDQQGEEVAKLMKMAGASVRMDYGQSSNTSIATIDSEGNVKGISVGTCTITATYGSSTTSCTLTVKAASGGGSGGGSSSTKDEYYYDEFGNRYSTTWVESEHEAFKTQTIKLNIT